jgi:plasmid maintenance system antidote protein VapI
MGVSVDELVAVMGGRQAISPAMASALARVIGGTSDTWLRLQESYDRVQKPPRM